MSSRLWRIFAGLAAAFAVSTGAMDSAFGGDTLNLTVQGQISASCDFSSPGGAIALGDLSAPGSHSFTVTVNCNSPFAYAVVSTNRALVTSGQTIIGGTFDQTLPYRLTTSFAKNGGGTFGDADVASTILTPANAAPCVAASYDASCPFANSGADVSINQTGTLTVSWGTSAHPLAAGTFTDTITLTVRVM